MEPSTCQSRVSGANIPWLAIFIGLLLLGSTLIWLLSRGSSGATTRGIAILATRFTNGEQVVTFRLNPSKSEVTFADVVPVTEDGSNPTTTIRHGDYLFPVQAAGSPPSLALRYLALPLPGAAIQGRPVAYTPGRYTVAYTPTSAVNRLRAGVALERTGLDDWQHRVQKFRREQNVEFLLHKSHGDAVYVTSEPITNGPARDESSR